MLTAHSRHQSGILAALLVFVLQSADGGAWQNTAEGGGVFVEEVARNSAGESAGIKSGDVLLSWVRTASPPANPAEALGVLGSPFDLAEIEIEEAPRGSVTLTGIRDGQSFSATLPPGEWKIMARPHVPEALLASYQEGIRLNAAKEIEKGTKTWQEVAARAQSSHDPVLGYWLSLRVADVLAEARRWDAADAAYREAMAQGKKHPSARASCVWLGEGGSGLPKAR